LPGDGYQATIPESSIQNRRSFIAIVAIVAIVASESPAHAIPVGATVRAVGSGIVRGTVRYSAV
jgi:hypothetical protein